MFWSMLRFIFEKVVRSIYHRATLATHFANRIQNMTPTKTKFIGARVEPRILSAFTKKAKQFGGNSSVLQALVAGFAEGRVTITPPEPTGIFAVTETKGT